MKKRKFATMALLASYFLVFMPVVSSAEIIPVEASASVSQSVLGSSVIPYKEVTLSAQIPGVIKFIAGEVGDGFNKDSLLAQVDDAQLLAKRNAVLAQIQTAQAALQNSEAQYRREIISPRSKDIGTMPGFGLPAMMDNFMTRPMADALMNNYDSDVGRYTDLVSSAAGLAQAKSGLQRAYSELQGIDAGVQDSRSMAPFEGIIMEKMVEVGDTVQPGQPLVRYGYVRYKRLLADVPSGLVGNLQEGMVVPARINSQTETQAKVSQIYPVADPERHTVTVKFDLPVDVVAAPGMYAEVYLPDRHASAAEVAVIPRSALLSGRSLPSVLVVENGVSSLRLVRLGAERGDKVEIVSGLKVGESIINAPPSSATSGWMPESR
ncbi:MAG: efflux RND transporter periplasmic adaptor subunit [Thiothrix sp.]|nr:efflux RND transporter periplasmic adaptor subunit [Thiothrix sp.]HPQ96146.1 efflux RND transporter periplasmic adaptor subunit [Thiolinea sp.]